jgi:parvulin-like peptidyl-prolyl isomerase
MRIIRTAFFCVLMIVISGCLASEAPEPAAEDKAAIQEEPQDVNSTVLVSLGEKALTMGQVKWMVPDGDPKKIASFTKMWLETELLYEQAQRQGLTEDKKEAFLADMAMKRSFVRVMVNSKFKNVEVTDEEVRDYYEKNKFEDLQHRPAIFSISHIRVATLKEAENTLKFVKGGEDFNELAKKVSIAEDAQRGGKYKGAAKAVEQRYGKEFLEALEKAQTGQVIGPVQVEGGFEIARMEQYTEASARPFERAKGRIKTNLLKERRKAAFDNFINELKEKTKYKIEKSEKLLEMEKETEAPPQPGPKSN